MATNGYDPNDPNNQQGQSQGQQDPSSGSQGVNVSGSDATSAQGSAGTQQGSQSTAPSPAAGAAPKPTSSGNFQNLTAYLNANQNYNAGGGGLAGQVNQNLYNQGSQVNQNFQDAQNNYNQQVQAGTQQYDPNAVNTVLNNPYAYTQQYDPTQVTQYQQDQANGVTPAANSTEANWMASQQNPNALQQYNQMLNAQYQGPTQLDPSGTLQAQAQNYQNLTNQVSNENGRFNLLNQLYAGPGYSQGDRSLDNLILQGNPSQLAQLQGARTMGNQLSGQLNQDQTQAANAAAQAQATTANTAAQTLGATNNAVTGFDTQEAANVQAALANRDQQYQNVEGQLYGGNLDYKDAANFGLLGAGGTAPNIYNLNLPSYLTEATNQATNQNVATSADYNKIQALGQLLGNKSVGNVSQILASYNDPSQAGQFAAASPYSFNTQQEQADAASALKNYTAAQTPYQQQLATANAALNSNENSYGQNSGLLGQVNGKLNNWYNSMNGGQYQPTTSTTLDPQLAALLQNGGISNQGIAALANAPGAATNPTIQNLIQQNTVNAGQTPVQYLQNILNQEQNPPSYMNNNNGMQSYNQDLDASSPGSTAWLLNQVQSQQQNVTNANHSLDQLVSQYGPNRMLNITGAPQLASITPSGIPPNVDATNPALASIAGIGGVNNI